MISIKLAATAITLGAATFLSTALILSDGRRSPENVAAATRAEDEAALVARLEAALEEPTALPRQSPAEVRRIAAAAAADPDATAVATASTSVPATTAPVAAVAPKPAVAAAEPAPEVAAAEDSAPAPARFALDPAPAGAGGWIAAGGDGPPVFEIRPLPRRN